MSTAELERRLQELMRRRVELARQIQAARELGDLSENAEYHAAREEAGRVDGEILRLEAEIRRAQGGSVTTARVEFPDTGETVLVTVVPTPAMADPSAWRVSADSPLGRAILYGQGPERTVDAPGGAYTIRVLD